MGDFRIIIDATGGHGQDRGKKSGEIVDFGTDTLNSPEACVKKFLEEFGRSNYIQKAVIVHWPLDNYGGQTENGRFTQIVDDLLTGKRTGNF
jgi:hypothetical protein